MTKTDKGLISVGPNLWLDPAPLLRPPHNPEREKAWKEQYVRALRNTPYGHWLFATYPATTAEADLLASAEAAWPAYWQGLAFEAAELEGNVPDRD